MLATWLSFTIPTLTISVSFLCLTLGDSVSTKMRKAS